MLGALVPALAALDAKRAYLYLVSSTRLPAVARRRLEVLMTIADIKIEMDPDGELSPLSRFFVSHGEKR